MDIRFKLIQLAQAGDTEAARSLLESDLAPVYRLALSILDDPSEAARATREVSLVQLEELDSHPGPTAHTAWLYRLAFRVCQNRLRSQRLARRLPVRLPGWLRLPPAAETSGDTDPWYRAVARLEEPLRLALVLRYAHDLLPQEAAQVLNWRDAAVKARLRQARQRLKNELLPEPPDVPPTGPETSLTHAEVESLIEAEADHAINGPDYARLKRHLEDCPRCQAAKLRLSTLEDGLRAAFQSRWGGLELPTQGIADQALEQRRQKTARRRSFSLGGAMTITLLVIGLIFLLPGLLPVEVLPPLQIPTQSTPAALPTPTPQAAKPEPVNRQDLLTQIYPGKIAFMTFSQLSDHLFTMEPKNGQFHKITYDNGEHSNPTWSPDGRRIAYLLIPLNNGNNQVIIANADGSQIRQVTHPGFPLSMQPTPQQSPPNLVRYPHYGPLRWSPDGHYLASAVWASDSQDFLALLPVDGGEPRALPVKGIVQEYVSWSPDGSAIAYLGDNGRILYLWQPDLPLKEGENPRPLNFDGRWELVFGLTWSPDSSQVAVLGGLRETDLVQVDIHFLDRMGKELHVEPISLGVLTTPLTRDSQLSWSPDGRYLAMIAVFTNADQDFGRILVITTGLRGTLPLVAGIYSDVNGISWSPDGRWLAYSAGYEIWAASLEAYERQQDHLVRLSASAGYELNWQTVN